MNTPAADSGLSQHFLQKVVEWVAFFEEAHSVLCYKRPPEGWVLRPLGSVVLSYQYTNSNMVLGDQRPGCSPTASLCVPDRVLLFFLGALGSEYAVATAATAGGNFVSQKAAQLAACGTACNGPKRPSPHPLLLPDSNVIWPLCCNRQCSFPCVWQ